MSITYYSAITSPANDSIHYRRLWRHVGRKVAAATTSAMAAPVSSRAAGSLQGGCNRVSGEASWRWSLGEAVSTAVVRRTVGPPSGSSTNDWSAAGDDLTMATAAWVVVGRCASGANAIVNSDASSLLYGPAEAAHIYTAVPAG